MAHRRNPPSGHQHQALPHSEQKPRAGGPTLNLTSSAKRVWAWLRRRFDVTYLIGWALILVGAAVFFAAQSIAWLQGAGGVIVGTGFTVLITTVTGRRAIHEQYAKEANLRRKDDLYGPLYAELRILREALQKACDEGGPYPQRIDIGNSAFDDNPMTSPGYKVPTLIHWPAFKRGYYWSDFTEFARQVLNRLIDLAEAYNRAIRDARDPTIEVLASEIEQAIQQTIASKEYVEWQKRFPTEASWYEAFSQGKAEPSWFRRLVQSPPKDTTLGQALARSWIMSWPIQQEPATLAFLLAGNANGATRVIHRGYQPGGDPAPPLQWIEEIVERTIPRLRTHRSYREAQVALDQLYACVREAEAMLARALNDIQQRYEGGRPPL